MPSKYSQLSPERRKSIRKAHQKSLKKMRIKHRKEFEAKGIKTKKVYCNQCGQRHKTILINRAPGIYICPVCKKYLKEKLSLDEKDKRAINKLGNAPCPGEKCPRRYLEGGWCWVRYSNCVNRRLYVK